MAQQGISNNPSIYCDRTTTSSVASAQWPSPSDQVRTVSDGTTKVATALSSLKYGGNKRKADSEVDETHDIKQADKKVKLTHEPALYIQNETIARFVHPPLTPQKRKAVDGTDDDEYTNKKIKQAHTPASPAQDVQILPHVVPALPSPKKRKVNSELDDIYDSEHVEKKAKFDTPPNALHSPDLTPKKDTRSCELNIKKSSELSSPPLTDINVDSTHTKLSKSDDVIELSAVSEPTPDETSSVTSQESQKLVAGYPVRDVKQESSLSAGIICRVSNLASALFTFISSISAPSAETTSVTNQESQKLGTASPVIKDKQKSSVTAKEPLETATSSSPKPLATRYAPICYHPLHPRSLPGEWEWCPPCLVKWARCQVTSKMTYVQEDYIKAVDDRESHRAVQAYMLGRGKKKNSNCRIASWRSMRVELMQDMARMENIHEKETKWNEEHSEVLAMDQPWTEHTCAKGLEEYKSWKEATDFACFQSISQDHAYDVASNLEDYLNNPNKDGDWDVYPPWRDDSNEIEDKIKSARQATIGFKKQRESRPEIYEKGVRWAEKVYVRNEADVDVLRKSPFFTGPGPHKRPAQLRSILRTTPHPGTPSETERRPEAGQVEEREYCGSPRRPKRVYRPATHVEVGFNRLICSSTGMERVNTSFWASSWTPGVAYTAREAYLESLWREEKEWDEMEKAGE
ncbi:hypothetical protein DM02DRAFT_649520 [Periconia macrospinosa]|uniref:Uncharacterized protein n=1 Tax=Periconia macrospinosa TaxID=97972 RepID=A0A2V1E9E7_9PLEO|nr:hypothetical protein DM02DRAFT_649520 [Periconia macrospinosa]